MRTTWLLLGAWVGLAAGCPGDDSTGESSGSGTETDAATAAGTATDTMAATTGGPSTAPQTSGTTSEPATTGGPSDSSGGGLDPTAACTETCLHLIDCGVSDLPNCGIPCAGIAGDVQGCEAEYIAQQQCVLALSCGDAQTWADGMMAAGDHPCADEDVTFQVCIQS